MNFIFCGYVEVVVYGILYLNGDIVLGIQQVWLLFVYIDLGVLEWGWRYYVMVRLCFDMIFIRIEGICYKK